MFSRTFHGNFFLASYNFRLKNPFDSLRKAEISFSSENTLRIRFIVFSVKGFSMNYVTNRFIASRTTDFINRAEKLLFNFDFHKFYHKNQHRMNVCSTKKLRYRFSRSTLQHACKLKRVVQISICTFANILSSVRPKSGSKVLIARLMTLEIVFENPKLCWTFFSI